MSAAQPLTQEEIQSLPRWARLALAARCVRRAAGLVRAPYEQRRVIDRAVTLAEDAAEAGRAGDELADAAAAAYTLVLNTLDVPEPGTAPPEDEGAIVTCIVAHAAAFAAEAATLAPPRLASYLVAQSLSSVVQAHVAADPPSADSVLTTMRADWQRLRETTRRSGWDDRTPVPMRFFG